MGLKMRCKQDIKGPKEALKRTKLEPKQRNNRRKTGGKRGKEGKEVKEGEKLGGKEGEKREIEILQGSWGGGELGGELGVDWRVERGIGGVASRK